MADAAIAIVDNAAIARKVDLAKGGPHPIHLAILCHRLAVSIARTAHSQHRGAKDQGAPV
jgi:hypothetical protein